MSDRPFRAVVTAFNCKVVQNRPGTGRVAIGFPDDEEPPFIFDVAESAKAIEVRDALRKWLMAHLRDNGIEFVELTQAGQ